MAGRSPSEDTPRHRWLQEQTRASRDMDRDTLAAITRLLRVAETLPTALEANFAMHGLSPGRHTALMLVAHFEPQGGSTPAMLADAAQVTRATMTGLLDGLQRDGLIERRASADDRRKVNIEITPAGVEKLRAAQPDHARRLTAMMAPLSLSEKRTLVRLLSKIDGALGALTEPAPPKRVRRGAKGRA